MWITVLNYKVIKKFSDMCIISTNSNVYCQICQILPQNFSPSPYFLIVKIPVWKEHSERIYSYVYDLNTKFYIPTTNGLLLTDIKPIDNADFVQIQWCCFTFYKGITQTKELHGFVLSNDHFKILHQTAILSHLICSHCHQISNINSTN
jgi:hypothetical protein